MLRKLLMTGGFGFLLSCASLPSAQRAKVEIETGASASESVVNGITHPYELGFHFLRSVVDPKESTVRHGLFVSTKVTDPDQVIVQAEGPAETPLAFETLGTKWAGCPQGFCSWTLEWEIELSDVFLRKNLDGYLLQASTNRGTAMELEVTSGQIWSQLVAVDSILVWGGAGRIR
jgi:hypothetical protein